MPTLGKTKVSPSLISTGSLFLGTSSYAVTASYAMNGGGGGSVQTGNIANQTILYNVTTSQDNVISGLNLTGNKWGVTVVEEWNSASIVGDQYYNSCSLLLHFSGSNGSTTIIDNSPNSFAITSSNGAAISTAQSKFGGSSIFFDGTNDYIATPSSTAFEFGSGDFTIEGWIYPTANVTNTYYTWISKTVGSGYGEFYFPQRNGNLYIFFSYNGSSWAIHGVNNGYIFGALTINAWNNFAITRQGDTIRSYLNGISGSTFSLPTGQSLYATSGYGVGIGANNDGSERVTGYADEIRITKGYARYTGSSYTTQSTEFPDNLNVTQLQTKYIGLVGGLNDSTVDYGVEKLSDSSLKIRKMTASGQPLSGSGTLSASVDRVYVNVLDYTNVMVTSSYALTASYVLGGIQTGSISNQTILYNVTTSQDNTITGLDLSGNKWDVSVIEEWNSGSGDIYYPSCSLLLHFSGSNDSTTFTDSSPNNVTVSANGNVKITSSLSKFGSGSAYFDGTGDYLSFVSGATVFGSSDFTIEFWANFSDIGAFRPLISRRSDCVNATNISIEINRQADNTIDARAYVGSTATQITSTATTALNTWYHIATARSGSLYYLFINGNLQTSASITGTINDPGNTSYIGIRPSCNGTLTMFGYIDEFRITKGVARYSASFVTQSSEFLNQLPQYETKYVGLVGGLNDTGSDYGVQKLSDSSLKIRKMSVSGTPVSGSPVLSASVDRVYVNVLNYKEVQTTAQSASYAVTSSYAQTTPSGKSIALSFILG